jgi:hypothetical protein
MRLPGRVMRTPATVRRRNTGCWRERQGLIFGRLRPRFFNRELWILGSAFLAISIAFAATFLPVATTIFHGNKTALHQTSIR